MASTISKAAIVVFFMLSYPLQLHPCRASIDAVLRWRPLKSKSSHDLSNSSPSRGLPLLPPSMGNGPSKRDAMGETRFAVLSTTLIVLSYLVAMTVSSLERVLAYVGSTGSTSISFILPGLFYYKISDPDSILQQKFVKEDDDGGDDDESGSESAGAAEDGLLAGHGLAASHHWRKKLLRRMSLGLAIYGVVVMVVCLITHTFFVVLH